MHNIVYFIDKPVLNVTIFKMPCMPVLAAPIRIPKSDYNQVLKISKT